MSINNLPREILTRIFSYYVETEGIHALLECLARVCPEWKAVAKTPLLWRTVNDRRLRKKYLLRLAAKGILAHTAEVDLSCWSGELNKADLECILKSCPKLKTVDMSSITVTNKFFDRIVEWCPNIESLAMNYVMPQSNISTDRMLSMLTVYGPKLRRLSMSCNSFSSFNSLMVKIAETCHHLEELRAENVSGNDLCFPVSKFQVGCPKLRVLKISPCKYISEGAGETGGFPDLEVFVSGVVDENGPEDKDLILLLKHSRKLKVLDIRGCNVTTTGLMHLQCKNLEELYFSRCSAIRRDFTPVMSRWRHSLKELDLSYLNDENLIRDAVCALAHGSPHLEKVNFHSSAVTPQALKTLVRKCLRLQYLDLVGCRELPRGTKRVYQSRKEIESLIDTWRR